ncbi:MAG: alanine--tRNA ligase [Patescibacteria group bacterium]|jgi:alanyl-tRNA synthetase
MTSEKIRKIFIHYYKKAGHIEVPSSSLWPQDDPSVLLTTAGMQQFKPFFLGAKNTQQIYNSQKLVSIQKCFRTSDIDQVGDNIHNTFFEMLGNFSFNLYFKNEAIKYAWIFLKSELRINLKKLWATYYSGDSNSKKDIETYNIWLKYLPKEKIIEFGKSENWWGPPGKTGPCGPCSEIHYDFTGQPCELKDKCLPNCRCGRFMELWNLVFMQFNLDEKKKLTALPTKNIDTGMGLERLALILQKKENIFATDLFKPLLLQIKKDKQFGYLGTMEDDVRSKIAADHLKGSVFLLADGISFSNKEQGYILRRIFRRALDQFIYNDINVSEYADCVIKIYQDQYHDLKTHENTIKSQMARELIAYKKILDLDVFQIVSKLKNIQLNNTKKEPQLSQQHISAEEAFILYSTYGISSDRLHRKGFDFNQAEFDKKIAEHQHLSRADVKSKFGGHGINSSEWTAKEKNQITKYHTATHLLHQALREILGNHVRQQGSDINLERLRFDFEHPGKISEEEKNKIENLVNKKIKEALPINCQNMTYTEAVKNGALAFFKEKYPEKVKVYSIGDFSKEICGGPHVKNTNELGLFKITTEKSSSAGIRRIKAILQ